MSYATVHTRAQIGLEAVPVQVEVHVMPGLPGLNVVGLAEGAVREARDRVKSAISRCGLHFPERKVVVNLAPADLPKEGARFDLPIALGVLAASRQVKVDLDHLDVIGELSLSGAVRAVRGALPAAAAATAEGRALVLPRANLAEARLIGDARLVAVDSLDDLLRHLDPSLPPPLLAGAEEAADPDRADAAERPPPTPGPDLDLPDLAEVRGQPAARRALEIAASGGHSLLLIGPPGAGKSMLAARLPGILPPMTDTEALEAATVASVATSGGAGELAAKRWKVRPFRSPHHTTSSAALVGGGGTPRPGEISLAHQGVLFLDELPEFARAALEALREPLETGRITISRAARQADFPARFQLIAAMNPCPCGHAGDPAGRCRCNPEQVARYRGRLSGPLLDRIDLHITVPRPDARALLGGAPTAAAPAGAPPLSARPVDEDTATVRARVARARAVAVARQNGPNAGLSPAALERFATPDDAGLNLLEQAMARLNLSARGVQRVRKVARTIADMAGAERVGAAHVAEALRYRPGF